MTASTSCAEGTSNNDTIRDATTTTTTSSSAPSGCPYALHYNHDATTSASPSVSSSPASSSPILTSKNKNLTAIQALQLAKTSCPAFKSACPFRDVHDANDMKKTLQSLPPSHGRLDGNSENISESLRVALTHVHAVSQTLGKNTNGEEDKDGISSSSHDRNYRSRSSSFSIAGGCPFKTEYKPGTNFVDAMEQFSLFGFMAEVIQKREDDVNNYEEGRNNPPAETLSASSSSSSLVHVEMPSEETSKATVTPALDSDVVLTTTTGAAASSGSSSTMKRVRSHTSLSNALKEGTAQSHSAAESVHFVKEFIKGNIDKELYSTLMLNLFYVYETLEKVLDEHAPSHFASLYFPTELKRTETLREDVDFYLGVDMMDDDDDGNGNGNGNEARQKYKPSTATVDYMQRVEYIANTEPLLLLSHAYTRYLGDLSGGKVLARVAKRALNLPDKESGLAFYDFSHIPSAKVFKDGYRRALDELDLTDGEVERLVAEANVAFVLNMRIFEELDVMSGIEGASVRNYKEAVKYYDDCIQNQKNNVTADFTAGNESKCPFAMLGGPNPHKKSTPDLADMDASKASSNATKSLQESNKTEHSTVSAVNAQNNPKSRHGNIDKCTPSSIEARCPWPFVFFHDPQTGMRDWQTWAVIGLIFCFAWNKVQNYL